MQPIAVTVNCQLPQIQLPVSRPLANVDDIAIATGRAPGLMFTLGEEDEEEEVSRVPEGRQELHLRREEAVGGRREEAESGRHRMLSEDVDEYDEPLTQVSAAVFPRFSTISLRPRQSFPLFVVMSAPQGGSRFSLRPYIHPSCHPHIESTYPIS